jgi:NAD dependent epimerase/dehydratase family enzyme
MDDLIDLFIRFMREPTLSGAFNNTAPSPVTNREFAKKLAHAIHRPVVLRVPGLAMRILYGEMAHLYLTGQKVLPCRHMGAGRVYRYPAIAQALAASV